MVGEISFHKGKARQINKLNNSINKKEGNITWSWSPNSTNSNSAVNSQAGRHTGRALPTDSMASQEASTVHPNNLTNNSPHSSQPNQVTVSSFSSQITQSVSHTQVVRCSARLGLPRQAGLYPQTMLLPRKPAWSALTIYPSPPKVMWRKVILLLVLRQVKQLALK